MHLYKTFAKEGYVSIEIKRSTFIGYAYPIEYESEATMYLEAIQKEHREARHVCYAYKLGGKHTTQIQRYSDDGEPKGTAGLPILEVFSQQDCTDGLLCVVRYFGGILLGAAGLIRAYHQAATEAAFSANIVEMLEYEVYMISCDYKIFDKMKYQIELHGFKINHIDYKEYIQFEVLVKSTQVEAFLKQINEMSAGQIKPKLLRKAQLPKAEM